MFSFKGTAKLFHTDYTIYMYSYQQHTRISVFTECYFNRTVKEGLNCLPVLLNAMRMVIALLKFWYTLKYNFLFLCTNLECLIKNKERNKSIHGIFISMNIFSQNLLLAKCLWAFLSFYWWSHYKVSYDVSLNFPFKLLSDFMLSHRHPK